MLNVLLKKTKPVALVLRAPGTNCDFETLQALKITGFEVLSAHINDLISKKVSLSGFNLLVIPGGFSFGDYISAGKIFAVEILFKLKEELTKFFLDKNRIILGICNGFQVLVKIGLLPDETFVQKVTLTENDSGRFECRWVYLKVNKKNPSILKYLPDIIQIPVAHGEGKFFMSKDVEKDIINNEQILFQYCDEDGNTSCGYPLNPNGSLKNIAGITDKTGKIIALMPHPERFMYKEQFPCFRSYEINIIPFGKLFFETIRKIL